MRLLIFLFILLVSLPAGQLEDETIKNLPHKVFRLSPAEQKWLKAHKKIRVAFDGDFPPYSFTNESGEIQGVAFEIMTLLSKRLGVVFQIYPSTTWKKVYEAATKGNSVDVVATMVNRPERSIWFNFTQPYLPKSLVIVTKKDNVEIKDRADIVGKKITLVRNYQYTKRVREEFPSIKPLYVDNFLDGLKAVNKGKADAAITFTGSGHFLINKHKLNLKIAAFYDNNTVNESIAVRKDWPKLATILQKGLDSISKAEKQKIFDKWVPQIKTPVDYELIGKIGAAFVAVLILLLSWIFQIRRQNKKIKRSQKEALLANQTLKELQAELENLVLQRTSELKTSEHKYRSLVENLRDEYFFYRHEPNGLFTYVSPSISNILGYSVDEFLINHREYLTNNPINQNIYKYTYLCLKGEQQLPYEVEIYDINGRIHWLEVMDSPVLDDNGNCIGVDGIAHDITTLKETQKLLTSLSYYDELTGLANRRLFIDRLQQAINLANRNKWPISLFYLDLDRFKAINDTLGHAAGDQVLKETAQRMLSVLRDSDVAARMGGDEFVLLLPETDADDAVAVANKLRKILEQPYLIGQTVQILGSSIGIAVYPQHAKEGEILINRADTAMYHAKKGKLGFTFYKEDMKSGV